MRKLDHQIHSRDDKLITAARQLHGHQADVIYRELIYECLLTGKRVPDSRCELYARSGGSSLCKRCPLHPGYRSVQEATGMSKMGTCTKCETNQSIVANGMCYRCAYGPGKDKTKEEVLRMIAEGTYIKRQGKTGPRGPRNTHKIDYTPSDTQKQPDVFAFLTETDKLKIEQRAKNNYRTPSLELAHIISRGLQTDESIPITVDKVVGVAERVKNLIVPNVDTVSFKLACNMIIDRLLDM